MNNNIFVSILFAISCLAAVCFLWKDSILLAVVLLLISFLRLIMRKEKELILLFIFCASFGAFAEVTAILSGAWNYTLPDLLGIPYWLPILWGDAAIFMYDMGIRIKNRFDRN